MQRTAAIKGKLPLLVVAPYGSDDIHTAMLAEHIQKELNCFAVINYMWQKAPKYDYYRNKANCHNIQHCLQDVVRQEYLEWILKFKNIILGMHHTANIFYIRGCSNNVRKLADNDVDIVVGFGDGANTSYTCELHSKNALFSMLNKQGFLTYAGEKDGLYSAREPENMTQIFRNIYFDDEVESFELNIVNALRYDETEAKYTANEIANALEDFIDEQEKDGDTSYTFPIYKI